MMSLMTLSICMLALSQAPANDAAALAKCAALKDNNKRVACYDQVAKKAAEKRAPGSASSGGWTYSERKDPMTDEVVQTAITKSKNAFEFGSPYGGRQRASLMIRFRAEDQFEVLLLIERGQFMCSISDCTIGVRFDDQKATPWMASESTTGDPEILFLNSAQRFVQKLAGAQRVLIEAYFYQEGRRVIEFGVGGFKWNIPAPPPRSATGKECRKSFDCPVAEKCDPASFRCVLCDKLDEYDVCADPKLEPATTATSSRGRKPVRSLR